MIVFIKVQTSYIRKSGFLNLKRVHTVFINMLYTHTYTQTIYLLLAQCYFFGELQFSNLKNSKLSKSLSKYHGLEYNNT